jgi:hypothetical protein
MPIADADAGAGAGAGAGADADADADADVNAHAKSDDAEYYHRKFSRKTLKNITVLKLVY